MYNGIMIVKKEKGFTSHDVVAKLRGIMKQKKIGHTGTLDPDATGVLPVCLGNATKVCDLLTDKDKIYVAKLRLGFVTDTQDAGGTLLEEHPVCNSEDGIREAILSFIGEYDQLPPMYSAIKVNGKKLYELAREGKTVERKKRRVCISKINILSSDMEKKEFDLEIECSKGTYIRTLCHDIGQKLGCGGVMAELQRTRVGKFTIQEAKTLSEISAMMEEGITDFLRPADSVFTQYPAYQVKPQAERFLRNGNRLKKTQLVRKEDGGEDASFIRVYSAAGEFLAVYQAENGEYKPVKMFL